MERLSGNGPIVVTAPRDATETGLIAELLGLIVVLLLLLVLLFAVGAIR